MSTSLLYHACGVRGYTLTKTEFEDGMVLFHVQPQPEQCRCSACGSRDVIRRGSHSRWFRNVPFGCHLTWIIVDLPRVECRVCVSAHHRQGQVLERRRDSRRRRARRVVLASAR